MTNHPSPRKPRRSALIFLAGIAVFIGPLVAFSQARRSPTSNSPARQSGAARIAAGSIVSSGEMSAGEGVAFPSVATGPVSSTPPAAPPREIEDRDEPIVPVPQGEVWAALPQAPTPPTEAPSDAGPLLEPSALTE